ncbi:MAG TPA: YdeI/OmpD-associated family protein [Longimicrobiales bacterium]|nr:YdeI/OmpD-associated family protein [Longimicrobiales bacterium]
MFFGSPQELRDWFQAHHDAADVLWVGYHKKATGRPSVTWEESRDEALCFGWIDGVRHGLDDATYKVRFTPRRPGSDWSLVNIRRIRALEREGRMAEAGREAFAAADEAAAIAAQERRRSATLPAEYARLLREVPEAWAFYRAQPDGYRRDAARWILDAKRRETRRRRLEQLIEDSRRGLRIKPLRPRRR